MLVLARKATEAIKIGDDITVKVIAIRGGQVKIGIEAPSGIRIIRIETKQPERSNSGGNGSPPPDATASADRSE
jgi:carbon storage regulator